MLEKKEKTTILYTRGIKKTNKKFLDQICKKTERTVGEIINYLIEKERGIDDNSNRRSRKRA